MPVEILCVTSSFFGTFTGGQKTKVVLTFTPSDSTLVPPPVRWSLDRVSMSGVFRLVVS